jgi:hypothetical protein
MNSAASSPTVLDKRYFAPFDRTYADVTKGMNGAATRLTGYDQEWLRRLIKTFADERCCWNKRPDWTGTDVAGVVCGRAFFGWSQAPTST